MGNPEGSEKKVFDPLENASSSAVQDWQDPGLLRDIEAATGINLALKKSKKETTNLTNIKQKQNTSRKRLEKVVFNRSAMKRVAKDLNK